MLKKSEGDLGGKTNIAFLELPNELKACPKEAQYHFDRGNRLNIGGDLVGAFRAYRKSLELGFPDQHYIIVLMNDVRILLREIPPRNQDGSNMPKYKCNIPYG